MHKVTGELVTDAGDWETFLYNWRLSITAAGEWDKWSPRLLSNADGVSGQEAYCACHTCVAQVWRTDNAVPYHPCIYHSWPRLYFNCMLVMEKWWPNQLIKIGRTTVPMVSKWSQSGHSFHRVWRCWWCHQWQPQQQQQLPDENRHTCGHRQVFTAGSWKGCLATQPKDLLHPD